MGHKENIIEILKENELGLTYKTLLKKYEEKFNKTLWGKKDKKNGYYYLRELKNKGLVKTYIPDDRDGKIIAYKLTEKELTEEPDDLEKTTDNLVLLMIEAKIDSKEYGVIISEKEIQSSLERLRESGKIG